MKKFLLFAFCAVCLAASTGCGNSKNQLKCSKSETEDGVTMSMEYVINFDKDDKATGGSMSIDYGKKELANLICENVKDNSKIKCSGSKVTYTDLTDMDDEDAEEEDKLVGSKKADVKKLLEEQGMKCK